MVRKREFLTQKQRTVIDLNLSLVSILIAVHMGVIDLSIGYITRYCKKYGFKESTLIICREVAEKIYCNLVENEAIYCDSSSEVGLIKNEFYRHRLEELYETLYQKLTKIRNQNNSTMVVNDNILINGYNENNLN